MCIESPDDTPPTLRSVGFWQLLLVASTSLALGFVPLGLTARGDDVLREEQVRARCELKQACQSIWKEDESVKKRIDALKERLEALRARHADELKKDPLAIDQVKALSESIDRARSELEAKSVRVPFKGFLETKSPMTWSVVFGGLGALLLRLRRRHQDRWERRAVIKYLARAVGLYVVFTSFNWARGFLWTAERKLVSYVHPDISWRCFAIQEVLSFLVIAMIIAVAHVTSQPPISRPPASVPETAEGLKCRAREVRVALKNWTVDSFCLTAGMLPNGLFYWHSLVAFNAPLYIGSAVVMQALWGWLWLRLSVPLWTAVERWDEARLACLLGAMKQEDKDRASAVDQVERIAKELDPLGLPIRVVVGGASALSFLAPLLAKLVW